jgi:hypothetical protein
MERRLLILVDGMRVIDNGGSGIEVWEWECLDWRLLGLAILMLLGLHY